jgi:hypothetical protein
MLFIPLILLLISLLVIISTSTPTPDPEMTLKGKETDLSNQLHRLRGRK